MSKLQQIQENYNKRHVAKNTIAIGKLSLLAIDHNQALYDAGLTQYTWGSVWKNHENKKIYLSFDKHYPYESETHTFNTPNQALAFLNRQHKKHFGKILYSYK